MRCEQSAYRKGKFHSSPGLIRRARPSTRDRVRNENGSGNGSEIRLNRKLGKHGESLIWRELDLKRPLR